MLIGAFIPESTWRAWDRAEADRQLRQYRAFGINTFVTEAESYDDALIAQAHALGMQFFGGIACFLGRDSRLAEHPHLWPVLETGQPRPKLNWYNGVIPTDDAYNAGRLALIARLTTAHARDGFMLDCIRWPLHWEVELRGAAPRPARASFDPITLRKFLEYSGLKRPGGVETAHASADWILNAHADAWHDFRCAVITRFVAAARAQVGAAKLGVYLVPHADRALHVGQRAADLALLVDYLAPMAYHSIAHRPPGWVTAVTDEIAAHGRTLPVLQVSAGDNPDWQPLPVDEWAGVARAALGRADAAGLIAFTGPDLLRDGRGAALGSLLPG